LDDVGIFEAVVNGIKAEAGGVPLKVDPRPLLDDPKIVEVHREFYASVPERDVIARSTVLQRLGVGETSNPTQGDCASVSTPPPPPGMISTKANCPKAAFDVAAVALARTGGAYMPSAYIPGSPIDEREDGERRGQISVRVLFTQLDPAGASTRSYDFVMQRGSAGWTIVKKVLVFLSD
jgi:hypothetical protein